MVRISRQVGPLRWLYTFVTQSETFGTFPQERIPSLGCATPGIVSINSIHWVALSPSMEPQKGFGDAGNFILSLSGKRSVSAFTWVNYFFNVLGFKIE